MLVDYLELFICMLGKIIKLMFSGKVIREGNLLNLVLSHGMPYALETWIVLKVTWYLILTNVIGDRGYLEQISETYMINVASSKEAYHFFSHRPK